ncbi:hypothetical protein JVT61DRAFT_10992 [Boletus reticuloceps]|uniref:Uncharacterized protein n=1 Tax=Boletus reticuloceps TaxID=495285 RepID=A0A8I2YF81_9AGAM|nr:hypothetical protein JVT61DRAFT_10992 [Boletus reticuloceps]
MSHSFDSAKSSYTWYYPSTDPAPMTPFVVNTIPDYFGGRPSPPPSPPRARATLVVDDYTPCPPTPRCVPSCVHDEMQWSNALNSTTSQSAPPRYWLSLQQDLEATVLTDPRSISKQRSNWRADAETKGWCFEIERQPEPWSGPEVTAMAALSRNCEDGLTQQDHSRVC